MDMKRWALLVIGLYALILTPIAYCLACYSIEGLSEADAESFALGWAAIMTLCQAALLVVPVRIHSRRPVARRHLLWPVLVAVLSCCAMGVGMFLAVIETVANSGGHGDMDILAAGAVVGGLWITWAFLFGFYTGGRDPKTFMRRTVRFLIVGSILELLVAVPAHIIARHRDYCCAGYLSVWGLGLGISVMLFAFGPGVLALFVRRWRSVQVPPKE